MREEVAGAGEGRIRGSRGQIEPDPAGSRQGRAARRGASSPEHGAGEAEAGMVELTRAPAVVEWEAGREGEVREEVVEAPVPDMARGRRSGGGWRRRGRLLGGGDRSI